MRKYSWVLSILLFCVLALSGCSSKSEVKLEDLEGHQFSLNDFGSKWIIINYWATWCKPCYQEVPELNAFYQQYKEDKVVVLGVNFDALKEQTLEQLTKQMGIQFPVLTRDPSQELALGPINGVPITFILNSEGELKQRIVGTVTKESLESLLIS